MLIIDTHTHIFPDDIAQRILETTARNFNIKTYGKGTAADLISQMDKHTIRYAVVHMVSPTPASVQDTNTWLIRLNEERLIKFGTLHPRLKNWHQEIDRLKDHNINGVKLQPDVQAFTVDDSSVTYPLYEALAKKGMAVMFHVGGEPQPGLHNRSKPDMILRVAKDFPELNIIAAHLGGLNMWDAVYELLAGTENVFMETSLTYENIVPGLAKNIIKKHGHNKIFFGTDYPFAPIGKSLKIAKAVPFLSENEKRDIFGFNAQRFYLSTDAFGP
jgi:predicted TIM-barrel fold metal-dependent hydrolase